MSINTGVCTYIYTHFLTTKFVAFLLLWHLYSHFKPSSSSSVYVLTRIYRNFCLCFCVGVGKKNLLNSGIQTARVLAYDSDYLCIASSFVLFFCMLHIWKIWRKKNPRIVNARCVIRVQVSVVLTSDNEA